MTYFDFFDPQQYQNHNIQRDQRRQERNTFAVSNTFTEDNKPIQVVFCKYNPLHVLSVRDQKTHEESECPDRLWNPGEPIIKYND
ncbi:hypothetical protein GCK72_006609 [Caenorhabditis remanei]|nr:hypothetical protein GCK72_006609 [Caenorhabditis remanei]KAF1766651.1 hypothetical protein GCK72_006609 [Caenorhabditis remanei]